LAIEGDIIRVANQLVPYKEPVTEPYKMVLLDKNQLQKLFTDENSGVEKGFQNTECVMSFLNTVSIVEKFGDLYSVIHKAQICAKTGGTLLVYGIANSQLNSLLNSCDLITCSLRRNLTILSQMAENKYEQYVFSNRIRPQKTPWIENYRVLNNTFSNIVKKLDDLSNDVAKMRSQANSQTLYQQFQQAKKDTDDFLKEAEVFSGSTAKLLGVSFCPIPPPDIIELPTYEQYALEYQTVQKQQPNDLPFNESALTLTFQKIEIRSKLLPIPKGYGAPECQNTVPEPLWYYENSKWEAYDKSISDRIEQEWSSPEGKDIITIGQKQFNLRTYQETTPKIMLGTSTRNIRRGTWYFEDDDKSFTPYPQDISALLEEAAQKYGKFIVMASEDPKRVVVGTINDARQFRQGKNPKLDGRKVLRGTNGRSIIPSQAPVYSELVRTMTTKPKK